MTTLPDDHPDKWVYQDHTRAKHEVLRYYLVPWTRIVSDKKRKLRVFDCFAGRGDYTASDGTNPIALENISAEVDYPGSPLIILDRLAQENHLFREAECYFLEPNDNNREALKANLDSVADLPDNITAHPVDGEFAEDIGNVIEQSGGWGGFGFFFIDPFGLKALEYDTVSKVTGSAKFDCLITLMTKELIRWHDSEGHQSTFETLYGRPTWREQLEVYEPSHLETAEAEYYCQRVEEGGTEFTLAYMTTRGDSRELIYDLVFTTNDERGLEAMRESMPRCGSDYALAHAPQRMDIGGDEQATLTPGGMMTEEKRAKSYLVSRFAGQRLTFDEVISKILADPDRLYADSIKKDYRQYLKELHNEGDVEIPEREADGGALPGDYTIRFPEIEED